jgi:hypothetical protein
MPVLSYRYELRRGEEILSTGRLSREQSLHVGERVVIGGPAGIVRTVKPLLGELELRLVVCKSKTSSTASKPGPSFAKTAIHAAWPFPTTGGAKTRLLRFVESLS